MKRNIILLTGLLITNLLTAQILQEWNQNYGESNIEYLNSFQPTNDGGFILGGNTESNDGAIENNGETDYWIVKTDAVGNVEWEQNYGGLNGDFLESVQPANDGGYILGGYSQSDSIDVSGNYGNYDYWIVKTDSIGIIEWEKNYGGNSSDWFTSLITTEDGGFILGGYSFSYTNDVTENNGGCDYWIVKIDNLGNIEWEQNYGGNSGDYLSSILSTNDGGFMLAGSSFSSDGDVNSNNGSYDYWIVKIDNLGNIEWEQNYGGSNEDELMSIDQTSDGGFILGGTSNSVDGDIGISNNGGNDYWAVKIDASGNIEWSQVYGGSLNDFLTAVKETTDGNFILAGWTESNNGDVSDNNGAGDYWVIKTDALGNMEWERNYGGSSEEELHTLIETNDGFILGGNSLSNDGDVVGNNGLTDFWILKIREIDKKIRTQAFFDENGNGIWDEDEQILYNLSFTTTPEVLLTEYSTNGTTTFYIDPATYTVEYDSQNNSLWETDVSYTIEILQEPVDSMLYFPMQPVTDFFIQWVDLSTSITRCNGTTNVWLTYTNNSSEATNGYVNLVTNDLATFSYATPPVDSIAGDTLYWFYEDLYPTHSDQIEVVYDIVGIDINGDNLGQNIVLDAQIETWEGYGNDKDLYTSELICAYDPNDKLVVPEGIGEENYTLFEDTLFNYTIRFQNTGNDTAFNIIIKDTINENLEIDTYQFIASSHDVNTKINKSTRIIDFEFNDIYLPDSNVNQLGSQGFIKFSIERNLNLAENTLIENTAGIYFDANPPIVTNTTENRMVSLLPTSIIAVNTAIPFTLYPNPNTGKFTIATKEAPIKTLKIYNNIGALVQEKNINNFQTTIDLDVMAGIYFISIETEKGTVVEKIIIQ